MPVELQREREMTDMLLTVLQQMPNVASVSEMRREPADSGVDAVIDASINGKPVRLMIQMKNNVFPRDVRAAFWHLKSASRQPVRNAGSAHVIPMIAATTISEGAKDLLQTERIGYLERGGSLFLADDDLYVLIEKPATKASQKVDRPLFSGNRSSVIHALLTHPERWFSTHELAKLTFVSPSTVSVVFGELQKRDLVIVQGKGPGKTRRLSQPASLLDEWAKQTAQSPRPQIRRYYVPLVKPEELMKRIHDVCTKHSTAYVITHEWAAQLYSPYLSSISQVKCRIFPNAPLSLIASELKAREVDEGSNWGLIESDSVRDMLFEQEIRGLRVESPILAYLDLLDGEGRAKEMAEHLRQERIGF
jgi:DNA-binding transcriptional regulator YhcF (GntR family)